MKAKYLIGLGVLLLLVFYGISVNNGLVSQEENVEGAWAQVENQYQRRADLIPNLVNTVKGAANFEQETLTSVIEARSKATSINISASDLNDSAKLAQFQEAQNQLSGALSRLLVTVEKYPELKANAYSLNWKEPKTELLLSVNVLMTLLKAIILQSENSLQAFLLPLVALNVKLTSKLIKVPKTLLQWILIIKQSNS